MREGEFRAVEKEFPGDFVEVLKFEGRLVAVYEQGLFQLEVNDDFVSLRQIKPESPLASIGGAQVNEADKHRGRAGATLPVGE